MVSLPPNVLVVKYIGLPDPGHLESPVAGVLHIADDGLEARLLSSCLVPTRSGQ